MYKTTERINIPPTSIPAENGALGQTVVNASSAPSRRTDIILPDLQIPSKPFFRREPEQSLHRLTTDRFNNDEQVIAEFKEAIKGGQKITITSDYNPENDGKFKEFFSKAENKQYLPLVQHLQLKDAQNWLGNEDNRKFLSEFTNVVSFNFDRIREIFDIPSSEIFESVQSLCFRIWLPDGCDLNEINDFTTELLIAFPNLYELTAFVRDGHPLYFQNGGKPDGFYSINIFSNTSDQLKERASL